MLDGSQFEVQAVMQERILVDKVFAASEMDVQIDVPVVSYTHSERQNRIQFIMSRIEGWAG